MKDGMKTDINIGLSGSKLKIRPGGVIRKYSPGTHFEDRFELQVKKQLDFVEKNKTKMVTPKIYEYSKEYFDMEYIPGESYKDFFSKCNKQDLDNLANTYINYFKNKLEKVESYTDSEVRKLLVYKLIGVRSKSTHREYINYIIEKVNKANYHSIPKTDCHGDFSVSNMIFFKGTVCCIDFLDSYIDTVIVDMVKLKQDLHYKWILDINKSNLRIRQSFNYLWNKIYSEFKEYYNLEFTDIITILNWLRIEPYITTGKQKEVLNRKITNSKYYEEFTSTNSR